MSTAPDRLIARADALRAVTKAAERLTLAEDALTTAVKAAKGHGGTLDEIAAAAGMGRSTIARWLTNNPDRLPPKAAWGSAMRDACAVAHQHIEGGHQQVSQALTLTDHAALARRVQIAAKNLSSRPDQGSADMRIFDLGIRVARAVLKWD